MTPAGVLEFWFGADRAGALRDPLRSRLWWRKDTTTDTDIRARFDTWVAAALAGRLHHWADEPDGLLALVLLADQFTRNIHRDTPVAFAGDPLALVWCRQGIARGDDERLSAAERAFLYMPLEHSEILADQDECVARFERLVAESAAAERGALAGMRDYARRHRAVIARFGRFPHRNAIFGRASTAAELDFLQTPGSRF